MKDTLPTTKQEDTTMKQIWSNGDNGDHSIRDLCDGKIHWRQWKEKGEWIEPRYRERCIAFVHPSKKFITVFTNAAPGGH